MDVELTSFDNGSTSGKVKSHAGSGSILADACRVGEYNETPSNTETLDITIFNHPASENDARGRWIVGRTARDYGVAQQYDYGMARYASPIFYPMVCAMLAIAHEGEGYPLEVYDSASYKHINAIASIAPSYLEAHQDNLGDALAGDYEFMVSKPNDTGFGIGSNNNVKQVFYKFRISGAGVIPEGLGIYRLGAYKPVEIERVDYVSKVGRDNGKTIAIGDWGGRTSDIIVMRDGKVIMKKSFDTGLVAIAENISQFCLQKFGLVDAPHASEIIQCILKGKKNPDGSFSEVMFPVLHGEYENIASIVNREMSQYQNSIRRAYIDVLKGGRGIDQIKHGGGCALPLEGMLTNIMTHKNVKFVSKKLENLYMANAVGVYYWAQYRLGHRPPVKNKVKKGKRK